MAKTAWDEGYEAAYKGLGEGDNPYDRIRQANSFLAWRSGWYDVMYQSGEDNYCGGY